MDLKTTGDPDPGFSYNKYFILRFLFLFKFVDSLLPIRIRNKIEDLKESVQGKKYKYYSTGGKNGDILLVKTKFRKTYPRPWVVFNRYGTQGADPPPPSSTRCEGR
jgi:hypothetical protein